MEGEFNSSYQHKNKFNLMDEIINLTINSTLHSLQ